jgi:serine phosphatase RsbU (regulator of sigma subunit)
MFSDGYPDQFNKSNQKFSTRRMKTILTNSKHQTLDDLHQTFKKELNQWMEEVKQTDDILLIGLKF